ncbi:MAG TPA: CoA transferase [Casimicrobiaceae bacterium]|nr:CoA transferase [Casimicrobiaceae bacterium]
MTVLEGVRVVEMGLWVAGPSAGGILADWGADVVKIETLSGDPMRKLYAAMSGSKEPRCPPFDMHNRGKRSVAIDVNQREGASIARRLVAQADVFLTNMRPQYLRRAGLDHETLLASDSRLVYAILTGYGLAGPDKDAPGFDVAAFSARSGVIDRATAPGTAPPTLPGGMGDQVTALALVSGIAAALFARQRTGRGQLVSTSLLRAGVFCIGMEMSARVGLGRVAPSASRLRPQNPLMNSYRAADDKWFWLMGAEAERHWTPIATAIGAESLLSDVRFTTARERRRNADALVAIFDEIFARRTRDEWSAILREHGVWWAPVNSPDDLLNDAQVQAAGAFVDVPAIEGDGSRTSIASPVDFGATPVTRFSAPPPLGRDTDVVLRDVGIDAAECERLRSAGIIQ